VDWGAPLRRLSSREIGDGFTRDAFFGLIYTAVPGGGMERIAQEMAARLHSDTKLDLEAKVTKVDRSTPGKVVVTYTQDGLTKEVSGSTLAVTVRLGVLQAGFIEFVPPLSAQKQAAIDNMFMGSLERSVCTGMKPFGRLIWIGWHI